MTANRLLLRSITAFVALLTVAVSTGAQTKEAILSGIIRSATSEPLTGVTVRIADTKLVTQTDKDGLYSIRSPKLRIVVIYSRIGYKTQVLELDLSKTASYRQDITLREEPREVDEVNIRAGKENAENATIIDASRFGNLPSASGNFESLLKTLPGVSSNNELSAQYSVRGGNFDENLIYINDVEIYRPLLVRSGQQEGLSFINPDLASRVKFSAGGFEARYGDKLSSVLDVQYLRPDSGELNFSAGIMGFSGAVKSIQKNGYLLVGIRKKINQTILRSQEVKGSYQPDFTDYQVLYNRSITSRLSLSVLGNLNISRFTLEPESRETKFGTQDELLRLNVQYEGKEANRYEALMGAFTAAYKVSDRLSMKWISSAFGIAERETFDIEGRYVFDELEPAPENPDFEAVRANRGVGAGLNHARNRLEATVYSTELRTYVQTGSLFWESGIRYQHDHVSDRLDEFNLTDSAGYTLPVSGNVFEVTDVVKAENILKTNRLSAYAQGRIDFNGRFTLTGGVRGSYASYTKEVLISPRAVLAYRPVSYNDLLLRFSAGMYHQHPFYRELRNFDGSLNPSAKAQRSAHFLTGADYTFYGLGTRLKFTSELYYKLLSRLTPYKIENLRVRYFAGQQSKGYAAGADFSLNGEFVRGLESSFRLSLLKTEEDIAGDSFIQTDAEGNTQRIEPGYLRRPTDQRVNFSIFFQDRLLKSPTYKVHLNLLYGAALPVGPPQTQRYRDVFKIPAYKRADIGFSKDFLDEESTRKPVFLQRYFNSLTLYAEVFNLFNINNTVSYLWIKDVENNQYAIPNYLTPRQLNVRLIAKLKYKN